MRGRARETGGYPPQKSGEGGAHRSEEEERRRRIDELRSRDNDRFVDFENVT